MVMLVERSGGEGGRLPTWNKAATGERGVGALGKPFT